MKINKHIFIGVLLVLIMIGVVGTASAADSLDNNLTAQNNIDDAVSIDASESGENSISSTNDNLLRDGETTIYVDSNYDGDELGTEDNPYKTISTAVSNANGGDTIFIRNGEYNESTISGVAKPLTLTGETQGEVIIGTPSGAFFMTSENCGYLVFNNLVFKDINPSANGAIHVGGDANVNITNCVFDGTSGRYGGLRFFSTGNLIMDNCKFLNTKGTNGKWSTAICFGGNYDNEHIVRNTIINGSTATIAEFGVIHNDKTKGYVTLDNVTITGCSLGTDSVQTSGIISTKGNMTIKNSKIINNNLNPGTYNYASTIFVHSGIGYPKVNVETSIILNNTGAKYIVGSAGDKLTLNLSYNNIQNNTFATGFAYSNAYALDYNYWGSNNEPTGVTVSNWVIDDNGVFKLNDGSDLAKEIPRTGEAPVGGENSTFVSTTGDDNNTGSADSPVATIAKAVELAKNRSGEIFIEEGTYTENNIVLDSNVTMTITGLGNVVIDGNASSNSIFILHNNATVTFTNIRFTNNKARYGGAIFVNSGSGTGRTLLDVDITVENCIFDNMESSSRGAGIYLWFTKGNLFVIDSQFLNSTAGSWGGAICVGQSALVDGLNVEIRGSTFENCSANNGGACYLQADTLSIADSTFNHNNASYDSAAVYVYNSTASIDNCIITNNQGGGQGVAIKETMANKAVKVLTITNSVIENNTGRESTLPAIYVDQNTLFVSYSSLVNDLSVETRTATGYDAIYGQGIATLNNNWWGTNDPSSKVTGTNITMDNWVIMNVEANVSEAVIGDKVTLTVDFNHVNTTSGEIEELTGGVISKTHKVQFSSESGTFVPASLTVKDDAVKSSTYTVGDINDIVSVSSEEALVELSFAPQNPPYYGVIYVSKDGDDNNNGSEEYPVATIAKAIELASVVGGSGQIIVNEGTYNGTDYVVTKNLTITGVGDAILDAEGKGRLFYLPSDNSFDKLELNDLTLTNSAANANAPSGYYGTVIYNYAASEVVLNNVNIIDNNGGASTLISTTGYALIINGSVVRDNVAGKLIAASGKYDSLEKSVIIINTTFENNAAPDYRIIEAGTSSGSMALNITDSHFIGNTGKLGIVQADVKTTVNVAGSEFVNNTNNVSSGGAIDAYTLNVVNSSFIDNKAARSAGAIYINRNGAAVITKSEFINNVAGEKGSAIYNNNELTINYCVLLTGSVGYIIYHDGGENVMDANYNWWGSNDDPSALIGVGTYEDDWGDDADCEFDASKWVIMAVENNYAGTPLEIGDEVEFTVDFNHYTDSTGTSYELADSIPEVDVSASAIKGAFDHDEATTENGMATFVYTADIGGEDTINITSSKAVDTTVVEISEPVIIEVVYVGPDGDDGNIGSYDSPVATIAHAIEIAERGKIVIFEGNYTINATLVIDKDLDIRGEGTVIIDGNLTRIIENSANLNLTNIIFANGKAGFGSAILDDGNVTMDGCTFYNNAATSGTGGNIINNRKGTMTVNDSKFYNNAASRGVIASQSGTNLVVNNSEFYDNDMTQTSGASSYYGIVYSTSADTIVENTVFRNNKAKQGAGVWATRSTSAATGSLEVINCTFENNIAEIGTGGAIFTSGKVEATVRDSTFINNTATRSENKVGGQGGAIYTTGTSNVDVADSVFIDNLGFADAGIFVGATGSSSSSLSISNSVILAREGYTGFELNRAYSPSITAENNFWGSNSAPNVNATVEKWVIMSAAYDEATGDLAISFDKTNSTDGTIADYSDVLPDGFNVSVSSSSGALDETLPVISGEASTNYVPAESDNIIVKSGNAEVVIEVIVEPKVIYVSADGNDDNTGSIDDPVASIAHAIEIAEGRIVILEGTYATGDLGIISDDLNITGNGTVIIDAQNTNRILYVGEEANVVLENLIMINGASDIDSGALLGNANSLTLIDCTLANSSAGQQNGGAIYNVGKLTIINSTIANNTAKVGGAIFNDYSAKGTELTIIGSTFENNIANGNGNNGGGAIFAQRIAGLTIDNSTFTGNEALDTSSGGAIGIIYADADFTITDSKFIANHANGQDSTGGGAIYMVGVSNNERSGKLSVLNTLFEENTADTDGAAIYARATTVDVTNSVIFANKDPAGFAVFGYKTDMVSPVMTLNDNWWGTNDDPNDYVGGYNYKPTISRWAILTATNDTPIAEGNTVTITVSLDTYTDGDETGALATPITIPRDVSIVTTFGSIDGVLQNGEFTTEYVVPAELKFISAVVDTQEIVLFKVKTETVVEAVPIVGENGDTVAINVTVKTAEGFILGEVPVTIFVVDEINSTYTTDENSNVVIPISGLIPGNYSALITFAGDDDYAGSNATADVVVNKVGTVISVDDISVVYRNTDEELVATITDADGEPLSVDLDVVLNGENYTLTADSKGQISIPVALLTPGTYAAIISYAGDEIYDASSATVNVVVTKANTIINASDISVEYKDRNGKLVATITNEYGKALPVYVNVNLNGTSYDVLANSKGKITIPTKDLDSGNYTVTITYSGNGNYNPTSATAQITVEKVVTVMTAPDTSVAFKNTTKQTIATLTDANGKGLVVYVNVTLDGETFAVRANYWGEIKVSTAKLAIGTYNATISYNGDGNYEASNATAQITVTKAGTVITAPDTSVAYKNTTNKTIATITDAYGKGMAVYVNVTLNGETFAVRANYWGEISVSTAGLAPGTYDVTVSYKGNGNYNASTATGQITVDKAETIITAPDISVAYKDVDGELVATLTNAYGKPLSVYVTVNLNGANYDVRADSNGQISIPTKALAPGTYTATITYNGNGNYNPTSTTAQITVNKADTIITASDVTVESGDPDGKLVATLTNAYGKALKVYVTVDIDGESYDVCADSNGQINIPTAGLTSGTHTATITYKGNGNYNPTSTTANIVVKP